MKDYLSIIVTKGEQEWQQQGISVPRVGDYFCCRKDGSLDEVFGGEVDSVHWEVREGQAGMVVSVWLKEDSLPSDQDGGEATPPAPNMGLEKVMAIGEAGFTLAQYASYAEIVGALSMNRQQVRDACDTLFRLNGELDGDLDAAEAPMFSGEELWANAIARFRSVAPSCQSEAFVRAAALEEAARIVEAEVVGANLDQFVVSHAVVKNAAGHELFMSTVNVGSLLMQRAAAIRSIASTTESR